MSDKKPSSRGPKRASGPRDHSGGPSRPHRNFEGKPGGQKPRSSRGTRKPKHIREAESNDVRQAQNNRTKNLGARASALAAVMGVVEKSVPLDVGLDGRAEFKRLEVRDRAFARAIASAAIRRAGALDAALGELISKPLPRDALKARMMLRCGAAELLVLNNAPHAVVDAWVSLMDQDADTQRFKNLANAVLRRVGEQGKAAFDSADPLDDLPVWWARRWENAYGRTRASAMMAARSGPPPLDLSVKPESDIKALAEALDAQSLPTGGLRRMEVGAVESLPGFGEGDWWVQDAAAALPVRLLDPKPGEYVLDLCAAPGGKTLQIAATGAEVVAVDASAKRLKRLSENLSRTGLKAQIVADDAAKWRPKQLADAILLDAPCTATGTLRRRPDAAFIKQSGDVDSLVEIQARLIDAALDRLKPGGRLVYCTCSLEAEEGEDQIAALIERRLDFQIDPVGPDEMPELEEAILDDGTVRTRPDHWAERGGMDGFFIARLVKT